MPTLSLKACIDIAFGLIVVAFVAWVFHEGEKQIKAADARIVQAQVIHNDEVQKAAQVAIQAAQDNYNARLAALTLDPVHVSVCYPSRPSPVPSTPVIGGEAGAGGSDGKANVSPAVGSEDFDIGPFTDQLFDAADAQIEALQAIVRAQQAQMESPDAKSK